MLPAIQTPLRRLIPWLLMAMSTACSLPAPRPPDATLEQRWVEHAKSLEQLQAWQLRARFAVRSEEQGGQATLSWSRTPEQQSLQLNGPLGRGVVRIIQDAHGARLIDAEQREYTATGAEELIWKATGWQLPVANFDWWARGLPVPGSRARRELDDQGRLSRLRQQGWEIVYSDYVTVASHNLPSRLTLLRSASMDTPELEVRFVIERWSGVK